jgi:hypothetical protein
MNGSEKRTMSKTKRFVHTWGGAALVVALLLAALAVAGCAGPPPIVPIEPTATNFPPPPTDIPAPPPGPTPAALDFPIAAITREPVETVDDQTCKDCHTDEETLKAMATEEEQSGVESEGEG